MTHKELKQYLRDNNWTLETDNYRTTDASHTKVRTEFYISSNDECVQFCKVGNSKEKIHLFTGWEYNYAQCGHLVKYAALPDDVLAFVKDPEGFEEEQERKAKEIADSYDNEDYDTLPF